MSYFDRLQHDMQRLGIVNDDRAPQTYQQLVQLVDAASGKTNFDPRVIDKVEPPALSTFFARYALQLYHEDPLLSDTPETIRNQKKYGICNMAEYRLATAFTPNALLNPELASPIVTVDNERPVGIMQRSRNARRMLYYALHNDGPSGTFAGCFYQVPLPITAFTDSLKSDHAWVMPVDELAGRPDNGRLSTFTIPTMEREHLDVDDPIERSALTRSHQSLAAWARRALDNAEPIAIK